MLSSLSLPEEHQEPRVLSPLLNSSSTAINAESPSTASASEAGACSIKDEGDGQTPAVLPRSSLPCLTLQLEKTLRSQGSQSSRTPESFMELAQIQTKAFQKTNDAAAAASAPPDPAAIATRDQPFSRLPPNTPVRRTNPEACVQVPPTGPAVRTDATMSQRLWSPLKPRSQEDSMSSSSSVSSSDTIIDLSLPSPARKCVHSFSPVTRGWDPTWVTCCRSPLSARRSVAVSNSNPQPDLWRSQRLSDELTTCPVLPPQEISVAPPIRGIQRRQTWSRLYMEELKQASGCRLLPATRPDSRSKSLGDLTSDDICCHVDSTYRSISSSVGRGPGREHPQTRHGPPPAAAWTEQLRRLASVEPAAAPDSAVELEGAGGGSVVPRASRSHSRVRHIANRAKKNQERQKVQGLLRGRSASFSFSPCAGSSSLQGPPTGARGSPEGSGEDLLAPRGPQAPAHPDNTHLLFLLRL